MYNLFSETIQQYLENFIKTGNPNEEGLPQWPSAKAAEKNPPVLIVDLETRVENAINEECYLFLDKSYGNDK
ncbi:carboxylesterase family protein [Salinimicrobium sp. GXAS 041]|uniref:carboxylesterase family protein n=1 Tax=Salinimicrobium sp. GXAS 041 TaxID=3400806 RepID=UPI003C75E3D3